MTIRLACDSDQLDALLPTPLVFTYADLIPDQAALAALRARLQGSEVALIDRGLGDPLGRANVIDVERGTFAVSQVRGWFAAKRRAGVRFLTAYASRDTWAAIDATAALPSGAWRWYATLDGTMRIPGHEHTMVQFAPAAVVGAHCDLSVVWNDAYRPAA